MPYQIDPEIGQALAPMVERRKNAPPLAVHDVQARRATILPLFVILNHGPPAADVKMTEYSTTTADGHKLALFWYAKVDASDTPGPAILHAHGGGMIMGSVKDLHNPICENVSLSGTPVLSVDYRVAPERPHATSLVEDCYAGLVWLREHAAELKVDPARIAVMGESAGGGIVAGVALMARDRGLSPPLAKQILIYPMLDDRNNTPDEDLVPFVTWGYEDNLTGWTALLGDGVPGTAAVSEYAAPARAESVEGLPPTFMYVGTLDIFRDEDLAYAQRLVQAKISVEFHLYPGAVHAFEVFAPGTSLGARARAERLRAMKSF